MQRMTLNQLRATAGAGDILDVTLRGQGGGFFVEITTLSGQNAVLSNTRGTDPRRFGHPAAALALLLSIGIAITRTDTTNWYPTDKGVASDRQRPSDARRQTQQTAAYTKWLAGEVAVSLDDSRPNISHDRVMRDMAVDIDALVS